MINFVENNRGMGLIHQQTTAQKEVLNRRSCINKDRNVDEFE